MTPRMGLGPREHGPTNRADLAGATAVDGDAEYVVLGGGHIGAAIARRLHAAGRSVCVVDEAYEPGEIPGVRGDPGDLATLETAGITGETTVIVATGRDRRNLLVAQLVKSHFEPDAIRVLVNSPDRRDLFTDIGHEPVCVTDALSDAVTEGADVTEDEQ